MFFQDRLTIETVRLAAGCPAVCVFVNTLGVRSEIWNRPLHSRILCTMSLGLRLVLLAFASLFGVMLGLWAHGDSGPWFRWLPAAFCFAISGACIARGRLAQFFGSLIALGVLGAGLAYLVSAWRSGPALTGRWISAVGQAVMFCALFGFLAASYLRAARFGFAKPVKSVGDVVRVEFDDVEVRIRMMDDPQDAWNQQFRWAEVTRVCFTDGGLYGSDYLVVTVGDGSRRVAVPTEAHGGPELLSALSGRGLFPEDVWRRALGETGGGTHCWPPHEEEPVPNA